MNIEGTYTLQAPSTEVWHSLLDTQLLQQTIPGIKSLEQVSENTYAIVLTIKHAPLKGTYQGQITLSEQHYPHHYRLTFEGEGEDGTISGAGSIHLNEHNTTTVITYKGTLTYSKQETLLPSKLVKGAAKLLIQQFFTTLATQLPVKEYRQTINGAHREENTQHNGRIMGKILLRFSHTTTERRTVPSVFSTVVHLLGLGAGDNEQEQRWEQLLRNASILSTFLLLVWIGTRLPSRK
jgi:carbon monoxide dehydrogenase subunit G